MSFPVTDWQFWSVTLAAAGSLWVLVRPFLERGSAPSGPCSSCSLSHGGRCGSSTGRSTPGSSGRDRLVVLGDRR